MPKQSVVDIQATLCREQMKTKLLKRAFKQAAKENGTQKSDELIAKMGKT